jgi:hypothetical protein
MNQAKPLSVTVTVTKSRNAYFMKERDEPSKPPFLHGHGHGHGHGRGHGHGY